MTEPLPPDSWDKQVAALEARVQALEAMLRQLEFPDVGLDGDDARCRICQALAWGTHTDDCELAKLLGNPLPPEAAKILHDNLPDLYEGKDPQRCDRCHGTGTVTNYADGIDGVECGACEGTGQAGKEPQR